MCKHEKVCTQCVKEEIAKLEAKIKELKDKLPKCECNHFTWSGTTTLPYTGSGISGVVLC